MNVIVAHFHTAAEVQAIASMIEKQAQIVVKSKEVSEESKKRKEALLAQYANITDEEEYPLPEFAAVPVLLPCSPLSLVFSCACGVDIILDQTHGRGRGGANMWSHHDWK